MKYALVEPDTRTGAEDGAGAGRICEFAATTDDCFPVAPELNWVEVPDNTTTHDTLVDGVVVTYTPAPPPPPPELTPVQKLEAAGLTVAELRALLNLS